MDRGVAYNFCRRCYLMNFTISHRGNRSLSAQVSNLCATTTVEKRFDEHGIMFS